MESQQQWKILKRISLAIWDSIKKNDANALEKNLKGEFPISYPITDNGMSALSFACSWGSDEKLINLILSQNPDVNQIDNRGATPLHHAAIVGNV